MRYLHSTIKFVIRDSHFDLYYLYSSTNGIKDPEYSIECGVQELKAALISAEVEKPIDMEHIKLALQGDNFGNL